MTWFKTDDSFYDHPKVFDAPDCAVALWTRAGSWSSRNRTGGFVPSRMPARLCDDPDRAVAELVRRGLWTRASGGFRFHDWTDYNPSAEEATAAATKMSAAGVLGNHRRWHLKAGRFEPSCQYCSSGTRSGGRDPIPDRVIEGPDGGPDADPMSDSALNDLNPMPGETDSDQEQHRVPDRVASGVPESPPNPPDPTRSTSGRAGGETRGPTHPREEPPSQCSKHQDADDPPPCNACKRFREAHEQWARDRAADAAARTQALARQRAETNQLAIAACTLCDDRGYVGTVVCPHDPGQADRTRRRVAETRNRLAGIAGGDFCPNHRGQSRTGCVHCNPEVTA